MSPSVSSTMLLGDDDDDDTPDPGRRVVLTSITTADKRMIHDEEIKGSTRAGMQPRVVIIVQKQASRASSGWNKEKERDNVRQNHDNCSHFYRRWTQTRRTPPMATPRARLHRYPYPLLLLLPPTQSAVLVVAGRERSARARTRFLRNSSLCTCGRQGEGEAEVS